MTLKVIGAGLGRTATFSLKFALEHLGLGPCYHMAEVRAAVRRNVPLWHDVVRGKPDWDAIFAGFQSTTDYPACTYWRELAAFYPDAKVVLSVRDPDSWFDSVSETIFSPTMRALVAGSPFETILYDTFGDRIGDRAFMTDWFTRHNQSVIDGLPPERLLVFSPKQGWEPLCAFLDLPVPTVPFPRVNSRDEMTQVMEEARGIPPTPETVEKLARAHIDALKAKAFSH